MGKARSIRILVVVAILASLWVVATAQQTQNPSQTNQSQNQSQTQQQNQNQPAQPTQAQPTQQQKKSFWQKMKDAQTALQQQGQNTAQQGQNTVQQGTSAVQQTMQNGAQGVQNGMQSASGQTSGAFSGGGGGAGACGANCFDAGPFQANVSQMTMSQEGAWHVLRMTFQFHNSTNQPLTIAYHDGSMVMVDNNGASYVPAGGNPGELQGMGIDRGAQTDSQFVLAPGQTGNALFSVARVRGNTSPVGTSYAYNLTIDELQAQNGAMAIPVRTYNLNFPTLAPGTSNASFSPGSSTTQKAVAATNTSATPASVVNNAAMKTPVTNNATQRPAVVVVKPIPATTPATAAKKPAATPTTTTTTTTPTSK